MSDEKTQVEKLEDPEHVDTIRESVMAVFENYTPPSHTPFQLTNFVVEGNGYTDWGKLRQAANETISRLDGIESKRDKIEAMELDLADLDNDIAEVEHKLTLNTLDQFERKRKTIDLERKEVQRRGRLRRLSNERFGLWPLVQEAAHCLDLFLKYRDVVENRIKGGEDIEGMEKEYWETKLASHLESAHGGLSGRLPSDIVDVVKQLPPEERQRLCALDMELLANREESRQRSMIKANHAAITASENLKLPNPVLE